jgi:hypothetical protein
MKKIILGIALLFSLTAFADGFENAQKDFAKAKVVTASINPASLFGNHKLSCIRYASSHTDFWHRDFKSVSTSQRSPQVYPMAMADYATNSLFVYDLKGRMITMKTVGGNAVSLPGLAISEFVRISDSGEILFEEMDGHSTDLSITDDGAYPVVAYSRCKIN